MVPFRPFSSLCESRASGTLPILAAAPGQPSSRNLLCVSGTCGQTVLLNPHVYDLAVFLGASVIFVLWCSQEERTAGASVSSSAPRCLDTSTALRPPDRCADVNTLLSHSIPHVRLAFHASSTVRLPEMLRVCVNDSPSRLQLSIEVNKVYSR